AGSYTVYYKVTGDTNHNDIAEANLVVSIAKASLTITADDISISYNDEAPTYTVNYSGFVNNEDKSVLGGTLVFECVYEVGSNVSEYAITPSGNTSDNYEISYVSGTLTVNKIDSTLTAPTVLSNLVYTGSVQELVTAGSVTGGTLQYKLDNGGYVTDVPGATNAGTYTVYFKVVGDENHNDIAEASLEVSIAKADATLTAPTAKELTYSGEAQALINAGTPVGGTIQYKLGDGEYSENIPTATNAGSYTVYYKVTGDANHNDIAEASLDESIAKADSSITAPTIKDDLVFSGAKQELINAGSAVGGELQYSIDDNNYGTDIPKGLSAGTYTVYYKVVGDSNHKDIAAQSIEITIDKKEVEIIWSANDYTYNGSTQEVIASYKDVSDESVSLNVTIDNEFKNAGNYIATASFANNESNYKLPSVVTKEYSIAKATPEYIIPEGLTVITDNKLSAVSLPEGFAWNNPEQNVGSEEGSKTFKASFTPSDTTNYLVVEDIDITVAITAQWSVEDPAVEEVKAEIKGIDEVSHDIHLKVEVKVETSDNQSVVEVEKPEAIEGMIEKDEKIAVVFDVKLIRKVTVNGVETTTEIQPSDIKEGATIEIEMAIPENLLNESFRILHIHNDGTVKEMEYTRSDDQKSVIVTTDKLSEFAFVIKNNSSSPLVWSLIIVSFIVIILATAFLLLLFVFNKWII
ncbi:MAG: hypothetical protein K6G38_04200, partial [Gammaproteobacteria bacterium]|nr:hypothetical protein [Gammaproteobacteria bacterium]